MKSSASEPGLIENPSTWQEQWIEEPLHNVPPKIRKLPQWKKRNAGERCNKPNKQKAHHKDVIDIDGIITEFARLKGTHLADL